MFADPAAPHTADPFDGCKSPQKYRRRDALAATDRVGAPVHPVGEIHVEVACWPEHGRGFAVFATIGMAGRVFGTCVGLDFDDATRSGPGNQDFVEEQRGELARVPLEEISGKREGPACIVALGRRGTLAYALEVEAARSEWILAGAGEHVENVEAFDEVGHEDGAPPPRTAWGSPATCTARLPLSHAVEGPQGASSSRQVTSLSLLSSWESATQPGSSPRRRVST